MSWKRLLSETRPILFLCCLSFMLWLPMSSDSVRQGERLRVTVLTHLCSQRKCSLTMNAVVPYRRPVLRWGFVSKTLDQRHCCPWGLNPGNSKPRRCGRRAGGQSSCLQSDTPRIGKDAAWYPSIFLPLEVVMLHWAGLHQVYRCCRCVYVSANQHHCVLLVTVSVLKGALCSAVPWQPL